MQVRADDWQRDDQIRRMPAPTCFAMTAVWPCCMAVSNSAIASVFRFVFVFTMRSPIVASNLMGGTSMLVCARAGAVACYVIKGEALSAMPCGDQKR